MSASITNIEHAFATAATAAHPRSAARLKRERMREIEPHAGGVVVAR